jgi:mono/diheme cytochrome c family protein
LSDEDAAEMAQVLKAGTSRRGVATGPMAEVVFHSLQHLEESDIAAIVAYVRSLPRDAAPARRVGPPVGPKRTEELVLLGERVYAQHCTECHGAQGEGEPYVYPALAGNRLVTAASANNALESVLFGGYAPSTALNPRPYGMPPYAHRLSFEEIAAVLTYIRRSWGNDAPAVSPVAVERR